MKTAGDDTFIGNNYQKMWRIKLKNVLISEVCQFHVLYAYTLTIFTYHFISPLHRRCGDARFVKLTALTTCVSKHSACQVTRKLFLFLFFFFFVAHQPNPGLSRLIEVSKSHTIRDTHTVGLLWTSDQHLSQTATDTTRNSRTRRTFTYSAGFEPHHPRNRTAADLRLRSHGHQYWLLKISALPNLQFL